MSWYGLRVSKADFHLWLNFSFQLWLITSPAPAMNMHDTKSTIAFFLSAIRCTVIPWNNEMFIQISETDTEEMIWKDQSYLVIRIITHVWISNQPPKTPKQLHSSTLAYLHKCTAISQICFIIPAKTYFSDQVTVPLFSSRYMMCWWKSFLFFKYRKLPTAIVFLIVISKTLNEKSTVR